MMANLLPMLAGCVVMSTAGSVVQLVVGRIVVGVAVGTCGMYCYENLVERARFGSGLTPMFLSRYWVRTDPHVPLGGGSPLCSGPGRHVVRGDGDGRGSLVVSP